MNTAEEEKQRHTEEEAPAARTGGRVLPSILGTIRPTTAAEVAAPAEETQAADAADSEAIPEGADADAAAAVQSAEPRIDAHGRAYATGKRKDAIARVWIRPGDGKITVNGKEFQSYFARPVLTMILRHPLVLTSREKQYDVTCSVCGGGLSGQAGAARHGLSKALVRYEPELRGILKKAGALTRDARVVERKKYGRRKARRSFQFSKR